MLPSALVSTLFADSPSSPLGLHLGLPSAEASKALPTWFDGQLPTETGAVDSGVPATEELVPASWVSYARDLQEWFAEGEGALGTVHLETTAGKLSYTSVTFAVPEAGTLQPAFDELVARAKAVYGAPEVTTRKTRLGKRVSAEWRFAGPLFPSLLKVVADPYRSKLRNVSVYSIVASLEPGEGAGLR